MSTESINEIKQSGVWWSDPWWDEEHWYRHTRFSRDDFLGAIDYLKGVFNSSWCNSLKTPFAHPFWRMTVVETGLCSLNSIFALSERIHFVASVKGFVPVLESYKKEQQAHSADLEMFLAHIAGSEVCDVEFIRAKPSAGKTPDILVKNDGNDFVIECKTLKVSKFESWVDSYSFHYSQYIIDACPSGYDVLYYPIVEEVALKDFGDATESSASLAAAIETLPIVNTLRSLPRSPINPILRKIDGLGVILALPKHLGLDGGICMRVIPPSHNGRRLVQNALMKGIEQIQSYGKPGIIATYCGNPPNPFLLKTSLQRIFKDYQDQYGSVLGVLVFSDQNMLEYVRPVWVSNPYGNYDEKLYDLPRLFENTINPIL